jgi:hypothetical protein
MIAGDYWEANKIALHLRPFLPRPADTATPLSGVGAMLPLLRGGMAQDNGGWIPVAVARAKQKPHSGGAPSYVIL